MATQKIDELDNEMTSYIDNAIKQAGNNMFGIFLKAANPIIIPPPTVDPGHPKYDSIAWFHAYNYRRDHFLSGIDFSDNRALRTPLVKPKLDNYFNKVLIQSPDSIIPQALKLLKQAEKNKVSYQYLSAFLINNSVQSKIMGMDAVFVAIADEVYLSGKAFWADSTQLANIAKEVYLTRPNLIGNKAPELVMESIDGETISLHQLQNNYTIVLFYEFDCGHCKKTVPDLYEEVYMKFIQHNIDVFAVCMNDDHQKWSDFVEEHQLAGWYHVWDVPHRSMFRFKYNVQSTPLLYLIDKDKKIIAKKIDNDNLVMLLSSLLKEK
jgi:peroxiredoxin